MAVQTLVIENIVRGMNKVKAYAVELTKVDKAAAQAQQTVPKANDAMARTGVAAGKSAKNMAKLALAFGKAVIAAEALRRTFNTGTQRTESERRLRMLAQGYGEVAEIQLVAAKAAEKFGVSQTEANQSIAQIYGRLRATGVELSKIESVYNGFNTAAKLAGATAAESEGAFRQLAQALGSGALRGDEFNSIAEQAPLVLQAISKETGLAIGQLREFAADGKITADIVIRSLQRIEKEGADQLKDALGGPQQKVKDLQNAFEDLGVAFNQVIGPAILQTISLITNALTQAIALFNKIPWDTFGGERLRRNEAQLKGMSILPGSYKQDEAAAFAAAEAWQAQNRKPQVGDVVGGSPATATAGGGGGGASAAASAAKKAEEEAARFKKEQLELTLEMGQELTRQLQLQEASSNFEKTKIRIEHEYLDLMERIGEIQDVSNRQQLEALANRSKELKLAEATADAEQRKAEEAKRAAEEAARAAEAAKGKVEKYRDQLATEIADTEGMIVQMAQTVEGAMANAMSTAITGLIDGTKTAEEAFADMFKAIGKAFIDMATQMIAKALVMKALGILGGGGGGLFGGGGGIFNWQDSFAEGGYVTGPTNALIGEGGEAEYVIPESKMSGAMERWNAGASGSSVIPENGASSEGGGSSSGDLSAQINISGGVLNFNDTNYIKQDQIPSIITQAGKAGEARTLRSLQQSPRTRSRVGIR